MPTALLFAAHIQFLQLLLLLKDGLPETLDPLLLLLKLQSESQVLLVVLFLSLLRIRRLWVV